MKRKASIFLLIVLMLLGGCAGKNNVHEEVESLEKTEGKGRNFIFVCSILENEYWETCIEGIRAADAELGTTTKVIGSKTADNFAVEIIDYMRQAIDEKPDGIMAYAGIEGLFPLIEEATAKGIPVLALDSDAPDTSRVAYVGTDAYNAGYKAGQTMVELTGGTAKIGVLVSSLSAEKEMRELEAFQDAIADYDMEVVAVAEANVEVEVAEQKTKEMLSAHPEITAMFNTTAYNVTGAARVKKAQGLKNLVLIGYDDIEENLQFVREGVIDAILVQRIKQVGYQGVYLMQECIEKGGLPKQSYDTGTILVTKENVDTYTTAGMAADTDAKTVRVGYYSGDRAFQDGYTDSARKTGYAYEYYQEIAVLTGWRYEYVYGTRKEIMDMLISGDIDIVAGVYQTEPLGKRVLFSNQDIGLSGQKRFFAVNRSRKDLVTELNAAMEQISQVSPGFQPGIWQKYYNEVVEQQVLTNYEKEWLARKGKLLVGYIRQNMPISEQLEDGSPTGAIKDLAEIFSDYLRTDMELICYASITDMEDALKAGEIDMAFPLYSDMWLTETKGLRQTDSFISERVMLVYSGNYTDNMMDRVALSSTGIGQRHYIAAYYPESQITFYDSRELAFDAVLSGEEKCILGCASVIQRFLTEHPKYQELNITYLDTSENFCFAVSQDNRLLTGILNKAIHHIDNATVTDALMRYSAVETQYTLVDVINRYAILVLGVLIAFFAILVGVFLAYRNRTNLYNEEQAKTQASLEEALEEANAASEAKTKFLSSMSHDIRTPMNAIIGMTTIAQKNLDDKARMEDCLEKITLSSHHLLTLINNVLDISKIESGKLSLNPVNFSLRDMLSALVNIVKPQVVGKGLDFEVQVQDLKYEMVYADELRVNQVFINLLTNAIKYTPSGGKVILGLQEEPLPDDRVKVIYSVKDNGIGMSQEFMDNMYEIFTRAQDSRIDKIQGTGLGLSIVKQIVDIMGGTIDCQSEEGKGTTFTVTLEFPVGEAAYLDIKEEKGNSENQEERKLEGMNLLIAEDNDLNWEIISELLDMHGITAERAQNGQICIDMLTAAAPGTYDMVMMDIQMPVMGGREATQLIRSDERAYVNSIPIIAMTADAFAEDITACLEAGMDGHVSKPVDMDKLFQEMRKILAKREG